MVLPLLFAIAGVASALPQAPTTGSSCQQLGSGSQVGPYTVTCGADRPGGDLSNQEASSFSGCIPICDSLPSCVGFAYVGGSGSGICYFKSDLTNEVSASNVDVAVKPRSSATTTSSSAAPTVSAPTGSSTTVATPTASSTAVSTSASPTSTAGASCAQIGNGAQVGLYTVACGTDRAGGDLSNAQASSFSACIPLCDALDGCVGFAFVGGSGSGTCYFKSSLQAPSANPNVDVATKPASSTTSASASITSATASVTSGTASATSGTVSTTSGTANQPTPTDGASCQQLGNGAQVGTIQVECGSDRNGGDYRNVQVSSFSACIPICEADAQCVAFSYVPGTCYLKSTLNSATSNPNVDSGVKRSATTTTSRSTTAQSTTTSAITTPALPTTTPALPTTTPALPTTTPSLPTTTPALPTTTSRPTTTLATTTRASSTTTRAPTSTAAPPTQPTPSPIFCTRYFWGIPYVVLCKFAFP